MNIVDKSSTKIRRTRVRSTTYGWDKRNDDAMKDNARTTKNTALPPYTL